MSGGTGRAAAQELALCFPCQVSLVIDVFSDVVCPWCYIGLTRLEQVIGKCVARRVLPTPPELRLHPFELAPGTEPGTDLKAELARKYGADPTSMFARVEQAGAEVGLKLHFGERPLTYPTLRAHTLLRHAAPRGIALALKYALFRSYFEQSGDIHDVHALDALAQQHGFVAGEGERLVLDASELAITRAELAEAQRLRISGVPFFIFDSRFAVSGAQPAAVFEEALRRMAKPEKASEPSRV